MAITNTFFQGILSGILPLLLQLLLSFLFGGQIV